MLADVSAISQNRPVIIEIKGLKTSHFKESKTAPLDRGEIGSMGHVECPQSEPANNDLQPGRTWMVAATNCERVGDQSRNGTPVSALGKTSHFDRRLLANIAADRLISVGGSTQLKPAVRRIIA